MKVLLEEIERLKKENRELDSQIKSMQYKISNLEEDKQALYQENQKLKGQSYGKNY